MNTRLYRGRFAPSPTGPLHIGSMVSAIGSYLDAKSNQGEWLLRIEDIDPPREQAGATTQILDAIRVFGLQWDGPVLFQSKRLPRYEAALQTLLNQQQAFHCGCTRKDISALSNSDVYPGTCRKGIPAGRTPRAVRVSVEHAGVIEFEDKLAGPVQQHLPQEVGDFVIKRADGYIAYQLAVVVDDAEQNITNVVRGRDLLDNTPRQIYLQRLLKYPQPRYVHLPVIVDAGGHKLSKQTFARPVDVSNPKPDLLMCLSLLGLNPPVLLRTATIADIWQWAFAHWRLELVPKVTSLPLPN